MKKSLQRWMLDKRSLLVGAAFALLITVMGNTSLAADTSGSTPEGVALQATSWLLTVPYGAVKIAYALGGGIVGSLGWIVTGGNTDIAEAIWVPSIYGDYIIQPQHLTGEKQLRFMGR